MGATIQWSPMLMLTFLFACTGKEFNSVFSFLAVVVVPFCAFSNTEKGGGGVTVVTNILLTSYQKCKESTMIRHYTNTVTDCMQKKNKLFGHQ